MTYTDISTTSQDVKRLGVGAQQGLGVKKGTIKDTGPNMRKLRKLVLLLGSELNGADQRVIHFESLQRSKRA